MKHPHKLFYAEVRLGNLVQNQRGELGRIVELSTIGVHVRDLRFDYRIICKRVPPDENPNLVLSNERGDIFTGIPLDEGWIIASGFSKTKNGIYTHEDGMEIHYDGSCAWFGKVPIDYLHELQNVYFKNHLQDFDIELYEMPC